MPFYKLEDFTPEQLAALSPTERKDLDLFGSIYLYNIEHLTAKVKCITVPTLNKFQEVEDFENEPFEYRFWEQANANKFEDDIAEIYFDIL